MCVCGVFMYIQEERISETKKKKAYITVPIEVKESNMEVWKKTKLFKEKNEATTFSLTHLNVFVFKIDWFGFWHFKSMAGNVAHSVLYKEVSSVYVCFPAKKEVNTHKQITWWRGHKGKTFPRKNRTFFSNVHCIL